MGGRLYDWLGAGDTPDRPDAALDMPGLLGSPGSTAFYFDTTLKILSIYDESGGGAWFDVDATALAALSFSTLPDVDFSTPPTDGQVFAWDTGSSKLTPLTLLYNTGEELQDAVGAMFHNGTGIIAAYNDGTGQVDIDCTITQYTDELAQDTIAAMLAAGSHTGITVSYNDAGNAMSLALGSVDAHTDVDMTGIIAGQGLVWDGAKFIPASLAGYTDEQAQDTIAAAFAAGTQSGVTVTYNDAGNKFDIALANERARVQPVAANFTLDNAGTASMANTTKAVALTVPSSAVNMRLARLTAGPPATPYSIIIRMVSPTLYDAGSVHSSTLFLRNSTSGRIIVLTHTGQNLNFQRWSSYTAFNAAIASNACRVGDSFPWRKITNDGTNLTAYISTDGIDWLQYGAAEPLATYINAAGGSVDQIGFGVINGVASGYTHVSHCQSFEVV